ncbi:MAG: hypothetical protein RLZZ555_1432, partial [Pseudomonadota bacterium]
LPRAKSLIDCKRSGSAAPQFLLRPLPSSMQAPMNMAVDSIFKFLGTP